MIYNVIVRAVVDEVFGINTNTQAEAEQEALRRFNALHQAASLMEVVGVQDAVTFEPHPILTTGFQRFVPKRLCEGAPPTDQGRCPHSHCDVKWAPGDECPLSRGTRSV